MEAARSVACVVDVLRTLDAPSSGTGSRAPGVDPHGGQIGRPAGGSRPAGLRHQESRAAAPLEPIRQMVPGALTTLRMSSSRSARGMVRSHSTWRW